ncbi:MAG: hypothetical protein MZV64_19720 [Ignavibacteriales bacterium]|nr:hypothetical protein [Ignavibacteriales bacterium]
MCSSVTSRSHVSAACRPGSTKGWPCTAKADLTLHPNHNWMTPSQTTRC